MLRTRDTRPIVSRRYAALNATVYHGKQRTNLWSIRGNTKQSMERQLHDHEFYKILWSTIALLTFYVSINKHVKYVNRFYMHVCQQVNKKVLCID